MLKKVIKYMIDILVILAVLLVAYYGFGKIFAKYNTEGNSEQKQVSLKVEFDQHDKDVLSCVKVGDKVKDGSRNELLGEITEVSEITNSVSVVKDYEHGKYIKAENPQLGLMTVTLKGNAKVSDLEINLNGTNVKIGTTLNLRTDSYVLNGKVMGIEIAE